MTHHMFDLLKAPKELGDEFGSDGGDDDESDDFDDTSGDDDEW